MIAIITPSGLLPTIPLQLVVICPQCQIAHKSKEIDTGSARGTLGDAARAVIGHTTAAAAKKRN
jgi:hypothetical protein